VIKNSDFVINSKGHLAVEENELLNEDSDQLTRELGL